MPEAMHTFTPPAAGLSSAKVAHHVATASPSRRALFAGAGALLAGAAISTAGGIADPAANADAELILDCQQHVRNMDAFNADPEDSGPNNPLWVEYERTQNAISDAKPMTMAGLVAKAQAAKAEAMELDGEENPEGTAGAIWAWDLVNDLVRLGAAGVVA